jgi:hypothetical protein
MDTENVSTRSEAHLTDPGPENFVKDSFAKTPKRAADTRSFFAKGVKILFILDAHGLSNFRNF